MLRTGSRIAVLGSILALLSGCVGFGMKTASEQRTLSAAYQPAAPLEVRTHNGAIEVSVDPAATQYEITATVKAAGETVELAQERLPLIQIVITQDAATGATIIEPVFPEKRRGGEGCSFVIRAPDIDGFVGRTSNGAIHISGAGGALDLDTSNGRITIDNHTGPVIARTSNGRITATVVRGDFTGDTSNGRIEVNVDGGVIDLETSNGDVICVAGPAASGPVRIDTSNGDVDLTVSAGFTGRLVADTSNGRVALTGEPHFAGRAEIQKSSGVITFTDDGPESQIDTSNGSIQIAVEP